MTDCEMMILMHRLKKIWIEDPFYEERHVYAPIRRVKYG